MPSSTARSACVLPVSHQGPGEVSQDIMDSSMPRHRKAGAPSQTSIASRLARALDVTCDIVVLFGASGDVQYLNDAGLRLLGKRKGDGLVLSDIYAEPFIAQIYNEAIPVAVREGVWRGEMAAITSWGDEVPISVTLIAQNDPATDSRYFVSIARDIGDYKRHEQALLHQVMHDGLTHLPNRLLLRDRLSHAVAHAERRGHLVGVLFIDLDNFKQINDNHGHFTGDWVLGEVAQRLLRCGRKYDTVGRYGGDEFLIILDEVTDAADIDRFARKVQRAFSKPLRMPGLELRVSFSIGIASYPKDGPDPDTLLNNADVAMYWSKQQGKNTYHSYLPEFNGLTRK